MKDNRYNILKKTAGIFAFAASALPLSVSAYDFAKDSGMESTAQGTGHTGISLFYTDSPLGIIGVIIGVVLSFLGIIFLMLIIYGGFLWMTASGNEEKVAKAKKIIQNSIVGLIIVLGAYAVTTFIGSQLN